MIDTNRYYIFDCNNKMIGNVFGYKTHSQAQAQVNRKNATVYCQIWNAFYKALRSNPNQVIISSIKLGAAFA